MVEERTPEAWIGQEVSLTHYKGGGTSEPISCTLREVSDRGVLVEEPKEITAFYPWSSVVAIKRGKREAPLSKKLVGSHRGY